MLAIKHTALAEKQISAALTFLGNVPAEGSSLNDRHRHLLIALCQVILRYPLILPQGVL